MGLQTGRDYGAKEIQAALRGVTSNNDLVVTIEALEEGDVALAINGTQITTSFPAAKYGKVKWTGKAMQDLIGEATANDSLDWSGA
jgi:hypothetical protein